MKFKYGDMVVVNGNPDKRILNGTVGMIFVADGSDFLELSLRGELTYTLVVIPQRKMILFGLGNASLH